MKKLVACALAAGALTVGGAASAQDFGNVLSSIFGGQPTYNQGYGYNYPSQPAVVAGAQQMYQDQYGRQFYYDQYGRQVYVQTQQQQQQIVGYDQWGRPVYGSSYSYGTTPNYTYGNQAYGTYGYGTQNPRDRDNDGVRNRNDRYPDDPRYR